MRNPLVLIETNKAINVYETNTLAIGNTAYIYAWLCKQPRDTNCAIIRDNFLSFEMKKHQGTFTVTSIYDIHAKYWECYE